MYTFYIPAFIFEFKQIRTVILEQEAPMCKLLIVRHRKSIKQIIPISTPNVFCSKHIISLKIWVQYMTKHDLQKISKTSNPFFSKLIWCNISTSLTELFNYKLRLWPGAISMSKKKKILQLPAEFQNGRLKWQFCALIFYAFGSHFPLKHAIWSILLSKCS